MFTAVALLLCLCYHAYRVIFFLFYEAFYMPVREWATTQGRCVADFPCTHGPVNGIIFSLLS